MNCAVVGERVAAMIFVLFAEQQKNPPPEKSRACPNRHTEDTRRQIATSSFVVRLLFFISFNTIYSIVPCVKWKTAACSTDELFFFFLIVRGTFYFAVAELRPAKKKNEIKDTSVLN